MIPDYKNIEQYEKINFELPETPEVSIIIPVYNQFGFTYNCLRSIKKNSGNVSYEVIIADDGSTDLTTEMEKAISGVKHIINEENLRFLKNCNNAARYARGRYLLFLNNDTQVHENWLKPLVDLIKREDVGLVGSKFTYPDGLLQEAGGIVWKNGEAWNYGHRSDPSRAEFNYVKEADYISGASIMIRKDLWNQAGGFDERFAPAYYEDTDLCFTVRKMGYKVMYQPLSVVTHFEGISNGVDTSQGQKQYQIVNKQKFYDKWKEVLEKEGCIEASSIYLAKDRGKLKKQMLVVDHYVPQHDKDAGGRCTYMYLKMFVKMGFKVTFIGDNFAKSEPYTTELNQLGIEVLYGDYYYNNWKSWLEKNARYFDYIYLQRPHIAIKYIDLVKKYSRAKIFYFAHDLHHVRERREYELTGDKAYLESSEKWKKIEYELFSKADVGHVVGSYEQKLMQDVFTDKPIRNIPLYIYENVPDDINKDFSTRNDIMYVGGFGHPPNLDAVLWFGKEILPLIVKVYPSIKWHVIGSKPPKEVQALASENIIIEGFMSDEKLEEMYRTCRMAVVPLRVGAGVKGKVVEAAYYQIPLVTTPIGAEGISLEEDAFEVAECNETMADKIVELYENFGRLKELSDNSRKLIENHYTIQAAYQVLAMDMKEI